MQPVSRNFADSANMSFYGQLIEIFREAQTTEANPITKKFYHISSELSEKFFEDLRAFAPDFSPRMSERGRYSGDLRMPLQQVIQKFVFETIASLTPQQNGFIQERLRHYTGHTNLSCQSPGDVEPLLHCLKDCALQPLPQELQEQLTLWVQEAQQDEYEYEMRQIVEERIAVFLRSPNATSLNLARLELSSLPPIFHADVFATRLLRLDLSRNAFTRFPKEIIHLQSLLYLDLRSNYLRDVREGIWRLTKLRELHLSHNEITRLPGGLFLLQELRRLSLTGNALTRLSCNIDLLWNMETLMLDSNRIPVLPEEICHLTTLRSVDLNCNPLRTLPSRLDALRALESFSAGYNPALEGLPLQLFHLPSGCEVELSESALSATVLERLQEICNSPEYNGPAISYSMAPSNHAEKPLERSLNHLFALTNTEVRELRELTADPALKGSLQSWLSRLTLTADYQRGKALRKALACKVLEILTLANDNPVFRGEFFAGIHGAATTCGDRVALSVIKLGIAHTLATCDLTDLPSLAEYLIRGPWAIDMLEDIARKKIPCLKLYDEIEVYLGYIIMLRERLGIPIDLKEMLFFRCSALKEADLDEAADYVSRKQANEEARYGFLIKHDTWKKALTLRYPQVIERIGEAKTAGERRAAAMASDEEAEIEESRVYAEYERDMKALTRMALQDERAPSHTERARGSQ